MSAGLWTWLQDADEVNAIKEEGSERSCSSFTFCSSREGTSESGRLYRPLLLILVPPSPPPLIQLYIPQANSPFCRGQFALDSVKSSFELNICKMCFGGVINCFASLHIKKDHLHVLNPTPTVSKQ